MSVTSTTTHNPIAEYPKLRKHSGGDAIVLFTSEKLGVVVYSIDSSRIGEFCHNWYYENFVDLQPGESVTITQV